MSNDNDIWTLQREPDETDAEYEARAAMFRAEFRRILPDGRTIEQALADGDAVGIDLRDNLEGLAELDRGEGVDLDEVLAEAEAIIVMRERAARGDPAAALAVLDGLPSMPPEPGDEMPEDDG